MRFRWIASGVLLLALIYIFRAPLLAFGCNVALRWMLPGSEHEFTFHEAKLEDGVLRLSDLHLNKGEYRLDAQEIALSWKEGLHVSCEAPQIFVTELPQMNGGEALFTQLHVNASHGVLQLPNCPRLFFTLENDEIGHRLMVSMHPGDESPLLMADLQMKEREMTLHYSLDVDGELIMKCAALVPHLKLEQIGKIEAEGLLVTDGTALHSGKLDLIAEKVSGAGASCEMAEISVDLNEMQELPFIERLTFRAKVREGKAERVSIATAEISLSPEHDVTFQADCSVAALPLKIEGSGKLQEKKSHLELIAEGPFSHAQIKLDEREDGHWALEVQGHLPQLIDKVIDAQGSLKITQEALLVDELLLGVGESALRGNLALNRTGELTLHANVVEANLGEWIPKFVGRVSLYEMTVCGDLLGEFHARGKGKVCGVSLYTLEGIESELTFDTAQKRIELTYIQGKGEWKREPFRIDGELIGLYTYDDRVHFTFDKARSHLMGHSIETLDFKSEDEWMVTGMLNLDRFKKTRATIRMEKGTLHVDLRNEAISLAAYRRGTLWTVEKLKVGEITASGQLSESDFSIPSFALKHPLGDLQGEALFLPGEQEYQVYCDSVRSDLHALNPTLTGKLEGRMKAKVKLSGSTSGELTCKVTATAPVMTQIESVKPFLFTYEKMKGFELEANELRCVGALEQLVQLHLKYLDKLTYEGRFRDGEYKKFNLKKLAFQGDTERVNFQGMVDMEKPLEMTGELTGAGYSQGKILLHEGAEVIAIDFNKSEIKKIEGNLPGLSVKLTGKEDGLLHGTLQFSGPSLARFLPELSSLKLGKGFELQGQFQLGDKPRFSGRVQGDECELFDYVFHKVAAEMQLKEGAVQLSHLSIDDSAGKLNVKQLKLMKEKGEWQLLLPLVEVENLKPSLVRRVDKEGGEPKPFVISKLTFIGISGRLSPDPLLFGTGTLHFSQKVKKEKGLLDVPLDMMKDLGFDPNLLTPIFGELELKLDGDRCRVMAWKNSYSEEHRSDFHLAEGKEAYIDLKGNLHVDLGMKSHVAWKWSDSFSLQLRGTLEKPKYSLSLR